ncbi:MAG: SAM-dependent DNA methyltransferase [Ruminococcaceae bacterium]|nr:SAM-dependent DNA methyltransferase [Oscillospiraceae bacterium]
MSDLNKTTNTVANDKFSVVGTNINEKASMIWNVADVLRGPFKPHEYGLVILPMTVVKRFHDCLLPTHQQVLDKYEEIKDLAVIDGFLRKASGYQFYNTSKFTFDKLLADSENIESNFRDYLNGFSANVQDVLAKFDFETIIKRLVESNTLYLVIKEFASQKGYLGPDKISAVDCGYIFEDLVRRFSESFGEEAGAHFTSRDIIYLMTDLLLSGADMSRQENITVYDMTMGTSQMLSCMEERIHEINPDMEVTCFGQEFNPSTFAIAKADMMIRGGNPNNMRFGDTLSDDQFKDYSFRYIISNPPFGIDWKREKAAVEKEAAKGEEGRFAPGLPKISDGQQLFVLNGLKKLDRKGKMAIIQNGSPLFSGDAGSGPSNIRQYILENDWLSAIVQLSTDMFMNTGISTYIWVLDKDKPAERMGKVQLIDASHCFTPRRKSIGTKRNDISDSNRRLITQAFNAFSEGVFGDKAGVYCESKIFTTDDFGYNKIVVERPQRDENGEIITKKGKPVADASLRDTENVPLTEDIDTYFAREVLPYAPDAWIDRKKTKIGYEIPMTRYFYEYQAPEATEDIMARITALEKDISASLQALFHKEG